MRARVKLVFAWLHARRLVFLFAAFLFGCCFVVYALYGYPLDVVGYALLLGFAAGLCISFVDFTRFAAKHRQLQKLAGQFPTGPMPQSASLPEADYQRVIEALERERAAVVQAKELALRDSEEYYMLWAHQIKIPIAAMRLLLQSGEGLVAGDRAAVAQELFRIEQYVGMVLQYQRLHSLQSDLVLRRFPVRALVKQAAKNSAPLFIHKDLPLVIDEIEGSVVTDEKWFVFVLEQLFSNALKYTEKGRVRVYAPDEATLAIEDTGIGIPPEDLPRVFERGFTGAAGRVERSSTGIGLYLCRAIFSRLGFGIAIESEPGRGTRVLLSLSQAELEAD